MIVNLAIHFNDETRFVRVEINDVTVNRHLASKLDAMQAAISQTLPKNRLCVGLILAQFATELKKIVGQLGVCVHFTFIFPSPSGRGARGEGNDFARIPAPPGR